MLSLGKIKDAADVLKNTARRTDLIHAQNIIEDNDIYLKVENLQKTGSFKLRGASYKIANLSQENQTWDATEINNGTVKQGNIKATGLSAGAWKGTVLFNITLGDI